MQNVEELQKYVDSLTKELVLTSQTVVAAPGCLPAPCFPEIIMKVLGVVTEHEWEDLTVRDEVYNEDTEEKGIAEISIAKHRNGEIGMKRLAFIGQYTKFANLALGGGVSST